MEHVAILGSTGSVGVTTLNVIAAHPDQFQVFALTANTQVQRLFEQCCTFKPKYAVMLCEHSALQLKQQLHAAHCDTEVLSGLSALCDVVQMTEVNCVVAAIVGFAGLKPTWSAMRAGKKILLANKEVLVTAGHLFMPQLTGPLISIDSEHNALLQCFGNQAQLAYVKGVTITASGGPFRNYSADQLEAITPETACQHPTWNMGPKISIDSATMINKAFEVIETHYLYDLDLSEIQVAIHPTSIIHALVEYVDGSILAHMAYPDMRVPIASALAWPKRMAIDAKGLDFALLSQLQFEAFDPKRFPCFELALAAFKAGPSASIACNAANEVAIEAFLAHKLPFVKIAAVIEHVLAQVSHEPVNDLDTVFELDTIARRIAKESPLLC